MTSVKICGIRTPEAGLAAAEAGADFIGLMFAESKRKVTPQECYDIVAALKEWRVKRTEGRYGDEVRFEAPVRGEVAGGASWYGAWSEAIDDATMRWRPLVVGVFADQPADEVNDIASAAGLDLVQLSGDENADFVARIDLPVINGLHVGQGTDAMDLLDSAVGVRAAAILLDTASPEARGGTGTAFDWDIAAQFAARMPFLLAGGLTPENVAEAITQVEPWGVDVSTGVETDGKKDPEKIRAFIRAAKGVRVGR
ncbi:MAG TPA: phosphoribosylanthranilate isomerase [Tepidiformaceae bacterium]|nr:phosphoribosylanthranilate isomerase [Tepidiformaceae bacterium]